VNIKSYKLLQYLLIILLMMTPLRSAMAVQDLHCEMDKMSGSSTSGSTMQSMMSLASSHQMQSPSSNTGMAVTDMAITDMTITGMVQSDQTQRACCCCDDNACASDCDMGINVSILMPNSVYAAVFISVSSSELFSSRLLARALPPLSRPPVIFS
jgi:hypothetical protein